jgi:hypothetical protein
VICGARLGVSLGAKDHGAKTLPCQRHALRFWRQLPWRHVVLPWRRRPWRQDKDLFFEIFPWGVDLREYFGKSLKKDGTWSLAPLVQVKPREQERGKGQNPLDSSLRVCAIPSLSLASVHAQLAQTSGQLLPSERPSMAGMLTKRQRNPMLLRCLHAALRLSTGLSPRPIAQCNGQPPIKAPATAGLPERARACAWRWESPRDGPVRATGRGRDRSVCQDNAAAVLSFQASSSAAEPNAGRCLALPVHVKELVRPTAGPSRKKEFPVTWWERDLRSTYHTSG